ncbi:MAG: branched-chain amino acid ABC transporter permease [Actinomycetia bacterium]|nr:branched-chain amino acid ABC transporter permease [Actinomycetes bacterium]
MSWSDILSNALTAAVALNAAWFALAAIGLNVHFGYTGLLNFGQIGFASIAAYGVGVSVTYYGWSIWVGMGVGVLMSVLLALLLGLPALRLRADYLAIVTIAASEIIRLVARSVALRDFSGGSNGINGFSSQFYELSPFDPSSEYRIGPIFFSNGRLLFVTLVTWGLVALAALAVYLLMRSPWGRILKAIREDEDAARALGKSAYWYKIQSLVFGGVLGGLAGMMFAIGTATVQPDNFQPPQTFFIWAALIIGGIGRVWGPIVGAMIFWSLLSLTENILRPMAAGNYSVFGLFDFNTIMEGVQVGQVRFMLVGVGLLLLMIFRPQGLFGDRKEMALDDS